MKTVNKMERIFVTIICAVVLWATMFVGAYYWCYDTFNMDYDGSLFLAIVYGIVTGYWLIRKSVFRIINIVKS